MESKPPRFSIRTVAIIIVLGVALGILVYFSPAFFIKDEDASQPRLKMGGTSVAFFMMDKWDNVYRKKKGIKLDYYSTGSTKGVTEMIEKKTSIGFTHAALTAKQKEKAKAAGGEVLHIPVVICAVVPIYHLKELNGKAPLKFTGEVLADIFLGKIDKWNHEALKKLNRSWPRNCRPPRSRWFTVRIRAAPR